MGSEREIGQASGGFRFHVPTDRNDAKQLTGVRHAGRMAPLASTKTPGFVRTSPMRPQLSAGESHTPDVHDLSQQARAMQ